MSRHAAPARTVPAPRRRVGPVESLAVVVVAFVLAYFRMGSVAWRGVVWAEDGAIFLQDIYRYGHVATLLHPYMGYLQGGTRVLAELVAWLPLTWHGVALILAAVLVQSLVALFSYHVMSAHVRRLWAPAVLALAVAAVPVGPEVLLNIANLQWFLLLAGVLAPLWRPRRLWAWGVSLLMEFVCILTCAFGPLVVLVAVGAWIVSRTRAAAIMMGVAVVAGLGQALAIVASTRSGATERSRPGLIDLSLGYLDRVVGDGVLGLPTPDAAGYHDQPMRALAVLALLAVVVLAARRRHGWSAMWFPAVLLSASVLVWLTAVLISRADPRLVIDAGRYHVAPVLLLVAAGVALVDLALPGESVSQEEPHRSSAPATGGVGRFVVRGAGVALGLLLAFGLVTSYRVPDVLGRQDGPSWAEQVRGARSRCAAETSLRATWIPITPPVLGVELPCRVADSG